MRGADYLLQSLLPDRFVSKCSSLISSCTNHQLQGERLRQDWWIFRSPQAGSQGKYSSRLSSPCSQGLRSISCKSFPSESSPTFCRASLEKLRKHESTQIPSMGHLRRVVQHHHLKCPNAPFAGWVASLLVTTNLRFENEGSEPDARSSG